MVDKNGCLLIRIIIAVRMSAERDRHLWIWMDDDAIREILSTLRTTKNKRPRTSMLGRGQ